MATSEKIVSAGVFTNEIDQTFLPSAIADIGAAIVGPTVKGPAMIPTMVSSYSEYVEKFGDVFTSGSGETENYYTYLTSVAAKNYLKDSNQLTVCRVLAGDYSHATANVLTASFANGAYTGSITAGDAENSGNTVFKLHTLADGDVMNNKDASSGGEAAATCTITITAVGELNNGDKVNLIATDGSSADFTAGDVAGGGTWIAETNNNTTATNLATQINANAKFTATATNAVVTVTQVTKGETGNTIVTLTDSGTAGMSKTNFSGGVTDPVGENGILISGSKDNLRYEITSINQKKGSFTLTIRSGGDLSNRKQILETFTDCTLDPSDVNNYIGAVVGDQKLNIAEDEKGEPYLQLSGSYPNKSKHVRVEIFKQTMDYLQSNGNLRVNSLSASLPAPGSGSFAGAFSGGSDGTVTHPKTFYEDISENSSQGLDPSNDGGSSGYDDYIKALNLLKNQDEFDLNLLLLPGIIDSIHSGVSGKAIDVCESRGDCFVIVDPVEYKKNPVNAIDRAKARNSNYASMYWPWVQILEAQLNKPVWVPPSVAVSGVYAFNDKVAQPWFAPAGLNRGTITTALQAERKLTQSNRDDLYDSNVNPIATFPGQGVVVYGQKTLQKRPTALDRVNVRRLLIKVKKFIASSSRFLVFEQNNAKTRTRFLNIVNPFLEQVQSQSGVSAFRVVMDETNNTPDVVDRNQLYGQIFIQPTRTAEFIVLDFTVQPTGATFPE